MPLFRTSGDISSGFQSHSGPPYSHLAEAYVIYEFCMTKAIKRAALDEFHCRLL